MDFTLNTYNTLLLSLLNNGYRFMSFESYLRQKPGGRLVILRHDVDRDPENSVKTAQIEKELGIAGTYYFRIVRESNHPESINKIIQLGHEIGYHYEDLALCNGNRERAIKSFEANLGYFRTFYHIQTICMHGSPLSKHDNRLLWETYNYKDFRILGEPYFDIDFSEFLYLTDTGRCWNGERKIIRDKPFVCSKKMTSDFRSSGDIIYAAQNSQLHHKILLTVHPQRWTNTYTLWAKEIIAQNIKNSVKKAMVYYS